jgi:hypothetical protein
LDLLTFYHVPNAVSCPSDLWFPTICASLRMKHAVLILEQKLEQFPVWEESLRWMTGDNWSWLAPRSLSVIQAAYIQTGPKFHEFKKFLNSSK